MYGYIIRVTRRLWGGDYMGIVLRNSDVRASDEGFGGLL